MESKSLAALHPRRVEIPALIIVSIILFFYGLKLPVLSVKQLWIFKNTFSILTGMEALWSDKHYGLTIIIFAFSIIFPAIKMITLGLIWFVRMTAEKRQRILSWLEILGKWSMLDVFVVAVTIVAVKFGVFADAQPRIGIYFFSGSIILSMAVTVWIDMLVNSVVKNVKP